MFLYWKYFIGTVLSFNSDAFTILVNTTTCTVQYHNLILTLVYYHWHAEIDFMPFTLSITNIVVLIFLTLTFCSSGSRCYKRNFKSCQQLLSVNTITWITILVMNIIPIHYYCQMLKARNLELQNSKNPIHVL